MKICGPIFPIFRSDQSCKNKMPECTRILGTKNTSEGSEWWSDLQERSAQRTFPETAKVKLWLHNQWRLRDKRHQLRSLKEFTGRCFRTQCNLRQLHSGGGSTPQHRVPCSAHNVSTGQSSLAQWPLGTSDTRTLPLKHGRHRPGSLRKVSFLAC